MSNGLNLSFPYLSLSLCLLSFGLSPFLCISISFSFLFSSCQTEGAVVGAGKMAYIVMALLPQRLPQTVPGQRLAPALLPFP